MISDLITDSSAACQVVSVLKYVSSPRNMNPIHNLARLFHIQHSLTNLSGKALENNHLLSVTSRLRKIDIGNHESLWQQRIKTIPDDESLKFRSPGRISSVAYTL